MEIHRNIYLFLCISTCYILFKLNDIKIYRTIIVYNITNNIYNIELLSFICIHNKYVFSIFLFMNI